MVNAMLVDQIDDIPPTAFASNKHWMFIMMMMMMVKMMMILIMMMMIMMM